MDVIYPSPHSVVEHCMAPVVVCQPGGQVQVFGPPQIPRLDGSARQKRRQKPLSQSVSQVHIHFLLQHVLYPQFGMKRLAVNL